MRSVRFDDHGDIGPNEVSAPSVRFDDRVGFARVRTDGKDCFTAVAADSEEDIGVGVALQCAGSKTSPGARSKAVRLGETVVQVGRHAKPATIDAMLQAQKDTGVEATWCFRVPTWRRIVSMIEAGRHLAAKVVTAEIAAGKIISEGFERLLDPAGNHLKILVRV